MLNLSDRHATKRGKKKRRLMKHFASGLHDTQKPEEELQSIMASWRSLIMPNQAGTLPVRMRMNAKYFLDTNIFVYSFDRQYPDKQKCAKELIGKALEDGNGCISYQVVQEFLNVSTRKFATPLSANDAEDYLTMVLEPLCEIFSTINIYRKGLEIMERWQYSFYDSLIIASAISTDCRILYTEDLQHDQKIENLTIINPFI
jgi:predicted nucleic acid-binding protein